MKYKKARRNNQIALLFLCAENDKNNHHVQGIVKIKEPFADSFFQNRTVLVPLTVVQSYRYQSEKNTVVICEHKEAVKVFQI